MLKLVANRYIVRLAILMAVCAVILEVYNMLHPVEVE